MRLQILVADDDLELLDLAESELLLRGNEVYKATSGAAAIKILKAQKIDIVVSDFRMPDGNGLSILNFINTMKEKPVFFFFSSEEVLSLGDFLKLGASNFFPKKMGLKNLLSAVEQLCLI